MLVELAVANLGVIEGVTLEGILGSILAPLAWLMGVAWVGMELFTNRPVGDVMLTTVWSASSSWTPSRTPCAGHASST